MKSVGKFVNGYSGEFFGRIGLCLWWGVGPCGMWCDCAVCFVLLCGGVILWCGERDVLDLFIVV